MFLVVSQTIAATSPLLSLKMAYRSPKTGLTREASQKKLASEAYRAIAWETNSQTIHVCDWHVHRKYLHRHPNYIRCPVHGAL